MTQNYCALAPIYDTIMSHVEYDQWVLFIKKILDDFGETGPARIFEIGGGTGLLGSKLRAEGYRYTGSDRSFFMCRQAMKRGLPFFTADARSLPLKNTVSFDMVIFLYDGINYLQTINTYPLVFEQVHRHLNRGAFFFSTLRPLPIRRKIFPNSLTLVILTDIFISGAVISMPSTQCSIMILLFSNKFKMIPVLRTMLVYTRKHLNIMPRKFST